MTPSLAAGKAEDVGLCPQRLNLIRQRLKASVDEGRTPAISALVARKGVVVLHEAHGKTTPASADNSLKLDDVFPVMSVGKPLAATAAMSLVEEGRLSLNRRLRDYIPEVQGDGTDEILVHLMTCGTSFGDSAGVHLIAPGISRARRRVMAGKLSALAPKC